MNFKTAVVQLITFSLLIFVNSVFAAAQPDSIYRLPAGIRIRLKMDVELSSRVASVNDTFIATVAKPVLIRVVVALPVGTIIEGRVSSLSKAAGGRHDGTFGPVSEWLSCPNKAPINIDVGFVHRWVVPTS